jgi:cell division protein FtsQ
MWDNPRLLNLAAGALSGLAACVLAVAALVLLARSPLFPLREIALTHALGKTTRGEIEAAARAHSAGNVFAVSPAQVRAALEALPWVRRASVRRVWPDRLEVALEEHAPFARWAAGGLLAVDGARVPAESDEALPLFAGPQGSERELVRRYVRFAEIVAPLRLKPVRLVLTERRAWQLALDNGLKIMLGRDADAAELRLERFVQAYPATLGAIARRHEHVDLRYPGGFALRVGELEG